MAVPVPDFGALAGQQKTASDQAANQYNLANRPNQYNPLGSSTWGVDAAGNWTQQTGLNQGAQGLFDQSMTGQGNLAGQIGQGLDYSSLGAMPQAGGYSQKAIDAWNALQAPGLAQEEDAARSRMANMGITMGSNAWMDQERALSNASTDARNKAILAGYDQGNTEFEQAMKARIQGGNELSNRYTQGVAGSTALQSMRDSLNPNKWMERAPTAAQYTPQNIYGAAQDTFNAQQMSENADIVRKQAETDSYIRAIQGLSGGGGISGAINTGKDIWNTGKDIWNTGKDIYNWWNSPSGSSDLPLDYLYDM